jgi:hypothetical protein
MTYLATGVALLTLLLVTGCGTTDSQMQQQGHSQAYIMGFHDGRHSGMKEEGNDFEHYIRDESRYTTDLDYQSGWNAGEAEGKKLQDQATAVGTAAATGMATNSVNKEAHKQNDPERAAKQVLKNTDTSGLGALEQ